MCANGEPVLWTRAPRLAEDVARFLNGEPADAVQLDDPAPEPRYRVVPGTRGRWVVVAADRLAMSAKYGGPEVAVTPLEELARKAAAFLNAVDPAPQPKARRRFGGP